MRSATTLYELPASFRGELISPEDPRFDSLCVRHNCRFNYRPAVIAQPRIAADAIAVVNWARKIRRPLVVRCGGLHPAGLSSANDAVVVDLGLMRHVTIDPQAKTARVAGGTLGGDLQVEASRYGLGGVSGILAATGLVGATLHGGFGLLSRRHGWGSDNVLAFDVVTADGELRTITPETEPELDWAMRGAGSSFGVVTSMVIKLHEIPPELTFGSVYFPADRWTALLPRIADLLQALPHDDGLYALVKVASAEDALPEKWNGRAVIDLVLTHFGTEASARRLIAPLLAESSLIHAHVGSANFRDLHFRAPQRASAMPGRQAWNEEFVPALTAEVGEVLARAAAAMETAPGTAIMQIYPRRSGMARPPAFPSCSALHAPGFTLSAWGVWEDPNDDAKADGWIEDFIADVRLAGGNGRIYLNAVSNIDAARARRAFGDEAYDRLMSLKRKYDPAGLFRGLLPQADQHGS